MSKIICDVCGTSYPETALQCPICGCVRPGDVKIVAGDTEQPEQTVQVSHSRVKGGRFSKSNVRKRNAAGDNAVEATSVKKTTSVSDDENQNGKKGKRKDLGLTVTVILLLLAIVAVAAYIVIRFLVPMFGSSGETKPSATTPSILPSVSTTTPTTQDTEPEVPTVEPTVPSVDLIAESTVALDLDSLQYQLVISDVEGEVTYRSDNEEVATVSDDGLITAVSTGETVIFVTCGDYEDECTVICDMEPKQDDPVDDPVDDPLVPNSGKYKISHTDVQLKHSDPNNNSFVLTLRDENGETLNVIWKEDYNVCQIEGNKITVIRSDASRTMLTEVYAEYDGELYKCLIYVIA